MTSKVAYSIILAILLVSQANSNFIDIESPIKKIHQLINATTSTSNPNWILKIIGGVDKFKKARQDAYLSNVV